jgi:hypothetical protein
LEKHQNKDWKIMMKNFRVVSVSAMMAAFAATSAWAAAIFSCPTGFTAGDGKIGEVGVCYYDMPKTTPADPLVIPADLKSFKLRYQGSDGSFTSKLNIHCQSDLNTVSVKGSAELAGGTLDILNRVNLDHFNIPSDAFSMLAFLNMTTEDLQPTTPMATCSNNSCDILKTTGLNALSVVFTSTGTGNTNSFELTVTQEQYDFGPMQVLNVQGIDRTGMLAKGAAMAGVDVSKIPAEAKNGLLLRGADENAMMSVPADIPVDYVYLDREFSAVANARSTIAFPFDIATDNIQGASEILQFTRIGKDGNNNDAVFMKKVYCAQAGDKCPATNGMLKAYKPYIVVMKSGVTSLEFDGGVTLKATTMEAGYADFKCQNNSNWVFRGVFEKHTWKEAPANTYGYAASGKDKDGNDLAGKFVKVGAGAYIYPFRGVLTYAEPSKIAPANSSYAMRPNVLPDEMNIVVEGDNNETTVIGRFNTRTGEMKFINNLKHIYDLKGRRVNGVNNARGAYYGKKVMR